jgi:imidazoleglycerol-phosphate dehydratase/histidinol-phosphatase
MLEQLAKHSRIDLEIAVAGDVHIDEHHTVEDTAIGLGQALRGALGDKLDLERYGFLLPMDEAESQVSIDLGGRAYFVLDGQFPRDQVGGLHTEMVSHFYRSLADALGCTLHLKVRGENTHHMVESTFKAVGHALKQAVRRTPGSGRPSTKGVL